MSYPNSGTLNGCISSLSSSVSLLNNSLSSLDTLTNDFGRLPLILDQSKIFTLVPEHDLNTAKKNLVYEIEPKIHKLVEMIQAKLAKLERKNSNLVSKIQLNEVRINNFRNDSNKHQPEEDLEIEGTEEELEQLRQLKLKKDRLKYKISSINLQNRKARLSMVNR